MKKSVLLIAILSVFTLVGCQENAVNKIKDENIAAAAERDAASNKSPEISFEEEEFDFGNIARGTQVEHLFKFENTGDAPLTIVDAKSSCGCTVPTWTKGAIAPGEKGEILVKFDGSGQNQVTKTVTLVTNTKSGRELLRIKAFVEPNNPTTKALN